MDGEEIREADFAAHLRSLGVETGGLSFGWMLNEYDSEGILRWIFTHLDSGNALTKREACRYAEIKENGLLSEEELESTIADILDEYKGITLPGDVEGLERMKQEKAFLEERLHLLNKQERTINTLVKQNELVKEEVTHQISDLKEQQARALAELESTTAECLTSAETVTRREEELFQAVAKHVQVFFSADSEGSLPKQFIIHGPLETYKQKRRLFKQHLKMTVASQLNTKQWRDSMDLDGNHQENTAAKLAEKRLFDGIMGYVETVADYYHTYNVIEAMSTPMDVHPSRVHSLTAETQTSLELLKQQEDIVLQEIRMTALQLAQQQTMLAETARARSALQQRRDIYNVMSSIHENVLQFESIDRLLYLVLRREWRNAQDTMQFAEDVQEYLQGERTNLAARIEAMKSLCQEHTECENRMKSENLLMDTLSRVYGSRAGDGLDQTIASVETRKRELKEEIEAEFQRKEQFLEEMIAKSRPILESIYDGCTSRPAVYDRTLTLLHHQLQTQMSSVEAKVMRAVDALTAVKGKDKDIGRKLWQWFLTDPEKLVAKIEELRRNR